MDWLLPVAGIAGELVQRTSSSARVQEIVQLSLAPVFLLAALGAMLNVMNMRLVWIVERVDRLEHQGDAGSRSRELEELPALHRRQYYAQVAVHLTTAAAVAICFVIALLFIGAFIRPAVGTLVALAWIASMVLVTGSLLFFWMETRLATASSREMRQLSRRIAEEEDGE